MKTKSRFPVLFAGIMLLCVLFLAVYLPLMSGLHFRLDDIKKSIETSHGRERKQQTEYDRTVAAIPETEAELELILPQVEASEAEVKQLKQERKALRAEKKELEAADAPADQEVNQQ